MELNNSNDSDEPHAQAETSSQPAKKFLEDWLELERAFSSGSGGEEIGLPTNYDDVYSQEDFTEQLDVKRDSP